MVEPYLARLVRRVNSGAGAIPLHGSFIGGEDTENVLVPSASVAKEGELVVEYRVVPREAPTGPGPVSETWLQLAYDDDCIEEYRIDPLQGALVVGATRLHAGHPTPEMSYERQADEWEGYRTTIPTRGYTATRVHEMSPSRALSRFEEMRSEYLTQELLVDDAIKIAAWIATEVYGVPVEEAVWAEASFKSECAGNQVRIDTARGIFRSLCERWSIPKADFDYVLFLFEQICRENAIGGKSPDGALLLDGDIPRHLHPRASRGPIATVKSSEQRTDETSPVAPKEVS